MYLVNCFLLDCLDFCGFAEIFLILLLEKIILLQNGLFSICSSLCLSAKITVIV